jgi:hypothetical protein
MESGENCTKLRAIVTTRHYNSLTFESVSFSDFVNEPVRGLKRSIEEMDPSFVMTGLARGTESLARHTLGVSELRDEVHNQILLALIRTLLFFIGLC